MTKFTNGSKQRTFCLQPGFANLFIVDDVTAEYFKERVDRYCGIHNNVDVVYDRIINGIRFDQVSSSTNILIQVKIQWLNQFLATKLLQ